MRKRDENKEQAICDKAVEIIVKSGFDGLSMQKLAKAASVSPATIYIYFKDREDLIQELCIRESRRMFEATMNNFDPAMHFEEGLRIQWKNRAAYWMQNPFPAQFLELARHTHYGESATSYLWKEFSSRMQTFISGAVERGELMPLVLEVYWAIAFSPLYTLIRFHLSGKGMGRKGFNLDEEIMEETLQLVLKALRPKV